MMKPKFTPGPWRASDDRYIRQDDGCRHVVARATKTGGAEANARLIAAAPDLYHALHDLLQAMGDDADNYPEMAGRALAVLQRASE